MADAVLRLSPDAKPTIGPSVEDGFYYDLSSNAHSPKRISKRSKKDEEDRRRGEAFVCEELTSEDAKKLFCG